MQLGYADKLLAQPTSLFRTRYGDPSGTGPAAEYVAALDHPLRPEVLPAYDGLLVTGDGDAWARVHAPDPYRPEVWDVYAPSRAWRGRVELPERFLAMAVRGDRVYGVWRDELGVEHVRAYALSIR
jgi:hypothetical protein